MDRQSTERWNDGNADHRAVNPGLRPDVSMGSPLQLQFLPLSILAFFRGVSDMAKVDSTDASSPVDESKAIKFVNWITEQAIEGVPPLSSAKDLAEEYLIDKSYSSIPERIDALINWETAKNFTSGFITGLGGILTLPVTVPAALGAAWLIQARMAGAIASICGHDLKEDRVRTLVLLSLVGDAGKEVVKRAGITIANKLTEKAFERIPGKVLIEINKRVGFRLLTKAGEKGVLNFVKIVPVAGGIVGGCFDAAACRTVGYAAKSAFLNQKK